MNQESRQTEDICGPLSPVVWGSVVHFAHGCENMNMVTRASFVLICPVLRSQRSGEGERHRHEVAADRIVP